jgi:hypothetical protein
MLAFGSEGVLAQLLVGAAGLCIVTIIAYYRTWSKDVDKSLSSGGKLPKSEAGGSREPRAEG